MLILWLIILDIRLILLENLWWEICSFESFAPKVLKDISFLLVVFFIILPKEFGPLQVLLAPPIRKTHDDIGLIDSFYVKFRDPEVIVSENEKYAKCDVKIHFCQE